MYAPRYLQLTLSTSISVSTGQHSKLLTPTRTACQRFE